MTRCLLGATLMFLLAGSGAAKPWKKRYAVAEEPDGIKVTIVVTVPVEKAQVWIDGKLTKQTGLARTYYTPPLSPGKYMCNVIARWTEEETKITAERTLNIDPEKQQVFNVEFKADSILRPEP